MGGLGRLKVGVWPCHWTCVIAKQISQMAVKSSCLAILYILGILQLITEGREQTQPGQTDV